MASEMVFRSLVSTRRGDAAGHRGLCCFRLRRSAEARLEGLGMLDGCRSKGPSAEWQGAIAARICRDIRKQRNQARGNDVRSGETAARHIDT